jgi:hypothetical protein
LLCCLCFTAQGQRSSLLLVLNNGGTNGDGGSELPAIPFYTDSASIVTGFTTATPVNSVLRVKITPVSGINIDGYNIVTTSNVIVRCASIVPRHYLDYHFTFSKGEGSYYIGNATLNWPLQYFVDTSTAIGTGNDADHYICGSGDETNPTVVEGETNGTYYYTGGNHGFQDVLLEFSGSHGKTTADISSRWTDGTYNLTLFRIYDATHLQFLVDNAGTTALNVPNFTMIGNTLTHVSGAQHTSAITSYTKGAIGLFGLSSGYDDTHLVINGDTVSLWEAADITDVRTIQFRQKLTFYDPYSVKDSLIANQPGGGYSTYPTFKGSPWHTDYLVMELQDTGKTVVYEAHRFWKDTKIAHSSLQQEAWAATSDPAQLGAFDSVYRYYPGMLPIGGRDFRKGIEMLYNRNLSDYAITKTYWQDTTRPVRRMYELYRGVVDGDSIKLTNNFGFAPLYSGTDSAVVAVGGRSWWEFGTGKAYPMIYSPFPISPAPIKSAGFQIKGVFFRGYSSFAGDGSANEYVGYVNGMPYVWKDFQASGTYTLNIPGGTTFHETGKTSNVSVSGSTITVTSATPMYGYLEGYFQ